MNTSELLKTVKILPFEETLRLLVEKVKNSDQDKWPVVEIALVSGPLIRGTPLKLESIRNESWILFWQERLEELTLLPVRYVASLSIAGLAPCSGIWLEAGSWSVDAASAPGPLVVDRAWNELSKAHKKTKFVLKADTAEGEVRAVTARVIEALASALAEIGRDKVGKEALEEITKMELVFSASEGLAVVRDGGILRIEFGYKLTEKDPKKSLQSEIEKIL